MEELEDPVFNLIGWYTQYLARQKPFDWDVELSEHAKQGGSSQLPKEQHVCAHDHDLVGCSRDSNTGGINPVVNECSEVMMDDLPDLIALSDDDDEEDDYRRSDINNELI